MATVTIPTFTGVKAAGASIPRPIAAVAARTPKLAPKFKIKAASLKQVLGGAVIAAAAGALLAGNVLAAEVKLGGDDGELAFIPSEIKVAPGETIVFKNNNAFPHNVIFDEDEVPTGVDVSKISMSEENLLNGPGAVFTVTLTEKGTYSYYCSPHRGVGMAGKIIVE